MAKRTTSDNILKDRACQIAINSKYDKYRRGVASMVCKFFDKKAGLGAKANVNEELAQGLHKPVIENLKRIKVYIRLKDNIWTAALAEMRSLSSKN